MSLFKSKKRKENFFSSKVNFLFPFLLVTLLWQSSLYALTPSQFIMTPIIFICLFIYLTGKKKSYSEFKSPPVTQFKREKTKR